MKNKVYEVNYTDGEIKTFVVEFPPRSLTEETYVFAMISDHIPTDEEIYKAVCLELANIHGTLTEFNPNDWKDCEDSDMTLMDYVEGVMPYVPNTYMVKGA